MRSTTAMRVSAALEELREPVPAGLQVVNPFDTTPFVRLSIKEVVKTLVEAIVLVFLVMFLFLQNLRATLIPTIAVPVVLLGTFGVLAALGFSINTLTLFGMVLAIGLLVDDAIVVVENVERVMREEGLSPREATAQVDGRDHRRAGRHRARALRGVPADGVLRRLDRRHLPPVLDHDRLVDGALGPRGDGADAGAVRHPPEARRNGAQLQATRRSSAGSTAVRSRRRHDYERGCGACSARGAASWLVYAVLVARMAVLFVRLPTAFLPDEDQGVAVSLVADCRPAPRRSDTIALDRAGRAALPRATRRTAVESLFTVAGFSFAGRGQNAGIAFVKLKPWDERTSDAPEGRSRGRAGRWAPSRRSGRHDLRLHAAGGAELGNATGFDLHLEDRAGLGHEELIAARNQLLGMAAQNPALAACARTAWRTRRNQVDIDTSKAGALGLDVADINETLRRAWGGAYIERLHRPRPRQARLHAGRRAVPHAAGGSRAGMCATRRARWCRSRLSRPRGGRTARRSSSATTACRR